MEEEEEKEVSSGLLKSVGAKHIADIFLAKVQKLLEENILRKEIVEKKEIALFLFKESQLQVERARESGKEACRYSLVMFCWCMDLLTKLGKGRYNFMSKVFTLPLTSTLKAMGGHNRGKKDGVMFDTCKMYKEKFKNWYNNQEKKGKVDSSWRDVTSRERCGTLGFNSCTIKAGIVHDAHTMEIVGFADKWENAPDTILAALESAIPIATNYNNNKVENGNNNNGQNNSGENNKKNNKKSNKQVDDFAEHYFVFYFTT